MPHNQEMLLNAACLYVTENTVQKIADMKSWLYYLYQNGSKSVSLFWLFSLFMKKKEKEKGLESVSVCITCCFNISPELGESVQEQHEWFAPFACSYVVKSEAGLLKPQNDRSRLN